MLLRVLEISGSLDLMAGLIVTSLYTLGLRRRTSLDNGDSASFASPPAMPRKVCCFQQKHVGFDKVDSPGPSCRVLYYLG